MLQSLGPPPLRTLGEHLLSDGVVLGMELGVRLLQPAVHVSALPVHVFEEDELLFVHPVRLPLFLQDLLEEDALPLHGVGLLAQLLLEVENVELEAVG